MTRPHAPHPRETLDRCALRAQLRGDPMLGTAFPAARLLLWLHVLGGPPPQVVTPDLVEFADFTAATSRQTLNLPGMERIRSRMRSVPSSFDAERLHDCVAKPHQGFCITYIGTTNFSKLHPAFVAMSARAKIPDARFIVCGAGGDDAVRHQAEGSSASRAREGRRPA